MGKIMKEKHLELIGVSVRRMTFHEFLKLKGYYRRKESRLWYNKEGKVVNGVVLKQKLQEWKNEI